MLSFWKLCLHFIPYSYFTDLSRLLHTVAGMWINVIKTQHPSTQHHHQITNKKRLAHRSAMKSKIETGVVWHSAIVQSAGARTCLMKSLYKKAGTPHLSRRHCTVDLTIDYQLGGSNFSSAMWSFRSRFQPSVNKINQLLYRVVMSVLVLFDIGLFLDTVKA